jgi:predicted MFS family arabinose efflux permease
LGLLSDGRTTGPTGLKNGTDRVSLRVVLRHRNLWLLTAGFSACGFHLAFIGNHLPAYIGDAGLPSWLAAIAISVIGAANAFGTYWFGTLGDRYPRRHVLATLYALRTLAIVAFVITPPTVATVLTFSFLMGLLWLGTVPLTSGLVAHLYGSGSMSMLYGFVFCGHQIGSFLGAWAGGWVFDATGSYGPVWAACVAIGIASAALHLPIRESHTQPKMTGTT